MTTRLSELLDGWALAIVDEPQVLLGLPPTDAPEALAFAVSRAAFADRHTKPGARALAPLIDTELARHPEVLSGRQVHALLAIAAADLLERDQLKAFLECYVDPGVEVWCPPLSVTALRNALREVLGPYESTKRLSLLTSLAAHTHEELLRWAPSDTPFARSFLEHHARGDSRSAQRRVAQNKTTAPRLLTELASSGDARLRWDIADNPKTEPKTIAQLAESKYWQIRDAVTHNPNVRAHTMRLLAQDESVAVRIGVAESTRAEPATLAGLAHDVSTMVRKVVASNPRTDAATLWQLAADPQPSVRTAIATHPDTSADTLAALAGHPDWHLRRTVAQHPNTPAATLAQLAKDNMWVRAAVAANPGTEQETLALLAGDLHHAVRRAVAANLSAGPEVLAVLGADADRIVQSLVAQHPAASTETLDQLARIAPKRIHRAFPRMRSNPVWIRKHVADNPSTSRATLTDLASDPASWVRQQVAQNPSTPPDVLARLIVDPEIIVRCLAAENPHTTGAALALATHDTAHRVVEAVARHRNTHPNTLDKLAHIYRRPHWIGISVAENPRTSATTLRRLARDNHRITRKLVAGNPSTSAKDLSLLALDVDADVRAAVASNPRTLPGARKLLFTDADPNVRAAAGLASAITDPHQRMAAALAAHDPELGAIAPAAIVRLAAAVQAVRAGARPVPSDVRNAATLPHLDDLPFPTASAAQARFADAPVAVRVLATGREQRQNGIIMDNCTLTDSYIEACQGGTMIVAAFDHDGHPYNIAWRFTGQGWSERDLAGLSNSKPSPEVKKVAAALAQRLQGLAPEPPLEFTTTEVLSTFISRPGSHPARIHVTAVTR